MGNESKDFFSKPEQEQKLVEYYTNILEGHSTPSIENQKKFLLQLLNTKISQIEPKTDKIRRIHSVLRIAIMLLSGISTVILGLKTAGPEWWLNNYGNIALFLTATVTFLSSLAVFWDTENYWIRNKIMLNKLKELRYEYVFFLEGDESTQPKEMKGYLDKFLANLGDEYWEKFLKEVNEAKPK